MAVKTTSKSSVSTKPVITPKTKTPIIIAAEEMILLHKHLTEVNAFELMKKYESFKKQLQEHAIAAGTDPAQPYVFHTEKGDVTFKPAAKTTVITNMQGLREALGEDLFSQLAKVGITDAKKYLGEMQLSALSEQVNGSRALASVVPAE